MYNAKNNESKKHRELIHTKSKRLNEQIAFTNATQQHRLFESVLALVFEADSNAIECLSTFHSVFGLALQHSKMFSERVNVDLKRTRLLQRALNEMLDEDNSRMHVFANISEKRSRSVSSPNPITVFLGSSDDEHDEPSRRLNGTTSRSSVEEKEEVEVDVAKNAMQAARRTLRCGLTYHDAGNGDNVDFADRQRGVAGHVRLGYEQAGAAPTGDNVSVQDPVPTNAFAQLDPPTQCSVAMSITSSHNGVGAYSVDSPAHPLPLSALLSVSDVLLSGTSPRSPQTYSSASKGR